MLTDDRPETDLLAKSDTHSNLVLFVPYELFMLLLIGFFVIDIQMHSAVDGLAVLPFWAVAAALCKRDLNGVRVWLVRAKLAMTRPAYFLDAHRWGGPSVSPWPRGKRGGRAV